jgi:hypothetical protein
VWIEGQVRPGDVRLPVMSGELRRQEKPKTNQASMESPWLRPPSTTASGFAARFRASTGIDGDVLHCSLATLKPILRKPCGANGGFGHEKAAGRHPKMAAGG